ncbi:MAG TPA: hypothetical protein VKA02_14715 [Candidatus Acidoferrum sp.]|nr:hypothetical protein [Candidatus Acidoferrum sp.]
MKKKAKKKKPTSAEQIAHMATRGEDISRFFTGRLGMVHPLQRVTVDFSGATLAELGTVAKELNISSEVLIRKLVREGLDRRFPHRASSRQGPSPVRVSSRSRRANGK